MATDNQALLDVENLQVTFRLKRREIAAVRGVSLRVDNGQAIGIVGESGSGKSVTGRALMGLLKPPVEVTVDQLTIAEVDVQGRSAPTPQNSDGGQPVAMVFQNPFTALNPVFRVESLLVDVLTKRRGMDTNQARAEALRLLSAVRIPDAAERLRSYPHELSGGMQQRVMIAMALALNPRVLIADEPTTALDVTVQAQILALLHELQVSRQMGLIFISHDLNVVSQVASQVYVMYAGKIVESGDVDTLFQHPRHPYTLGLMTSTPKLGVYGDELTAIPGNPPEAGVVAPGCAFHPRCSFRSPRCETDEPELRDTGLTTRAACHHSDVLQEQERGTS